MLGQADGTSWMAAFAKSMFSLALLLAEKRPLYEDLASKFWEHFIYIADGMNSPDRSKEIALGRAGRIFLRSLVH